MAQYRIAGTVAEERITTVTKKLKEIFGEDTFRVEKVNLSPSRADRLAEAEDHWSQAQSVVQELVEEMEQWHESIPENLQGGGKADEVEAAKDALQEILDALEQVDFGSADFPGMF